MTPNTKTEKELRESFQDWIEKGVWQGEDEFTKNFHVGNVADYWLNIIKNREEELVRKIEGLPVHLVNAKFTPSDEDTYERCIALSDIIHLLTNK